MSEEHSAQTEPDIPDLVEDNLVDPASGIVHKTAFQYQRSAPLPEPVELEHYERVVPGAADGIITVAGGRAAHIQHLQSRQMQLVGRLASRLMVLGTVVVLVGLAAASYLAFLGHSALSATVGIADILIAPSPLDFAEVRRTLDPNLQMTIRLSR